MLLHKSRSYFVGKLYSFKVTESVPVASPGSPPDRRPNPKKIHVIGISADKLQLQLIYIKYNLCFLGWRSEDAHDDRMVSFVGLQCQLFLWFQFVRL